MSCGCENKKIMCEYAHISELARKAAVMEGVIYVVYKRGGTYHFGRIGEVNGDIVEYRHYL